MAGKLLDLEGMRARLGGDEVDLMKELAEHFLERLEPSLTKINAAIGGKNARELEESAHALKSAISVFGGAPAVTTAQQLEDLGRSGKTDGAAALYARLESLARELGQELGATFLGRAS